MNNKSLISNLAATIFCAALSVICATQLHNAPTIPNGVTSLELVWWVQMLLWLVSSIVLAIYTVYRYTE